MGRVLLLAAGLVGLSVGAMSAQDLPRPLEMAITFDDLPAHGALPPGATRLGVAEQVLSILKAEKMPPVYGFVNGQKLEDSGSKSPVLDAWVHAAEPLGSHTYSHLDRGKITPEAFEADVEKNEPLLRELQPHGDWHWLRYPFLHEGDTLAKQEAVRSYLTAHGYRIAEVSMDFEDYLWNDPYARCTAKGDQASLQYLHDSYLATADQFTTIFRYMAARLYGHDIPYVLLLHIGAFDAKMLPELLMLMRSRGFRFVPLEEAEKDPAYAVDPAAGVPGGGALQEIVATSRKVRLPENSKPYAKLAALCR